MLDVTKEQFGEYYQELKSRMHIKINKLNQYLGTAIALNYTIFVQNTQP